jgi:protocatechuate 3,4-dioxygenase beta subunit
MPVTTARLQEVMPRIVAVVSDLARELDLQNDELLAALAFLGDVGRADEVILLSDVLGISRQVDDQTHAAHAGTPSNVLGPFYRSGAPWISNPGDIVAASTPGSRIEVVGHVTDLATGAPLPGATIDVWHANEAGDYSNEDATRDPWDLRGRQLTDAAGGYAFQTVTPLHYTVKHDGPVGQLLSALGRHPWRPAHIHFLVTAEGYQPLVTQVYIAGGPYLDDDAIDGVKGDLVIPVIDGRLAFDITLAA